VSKPDFSSDFPAKLLTTNSSWGDLVLPEDTLNDLNEIISWHYNEEKIREDWGYNKIVKPGFRTVFFGPSGTGKSLTAAILGQKLGIDVYRIDITKIVSKYIGETVKNLESLFKQAENKNWILFFDEAESLFGRRTSGSSVNDKYANQEVGYLLQRIEDYPGIVIIATNLKSQMDDAFLRRFQNYIHFPQPEHDLRELLWKNSFKSENSSLKLEIDYKKLANQFEITGGVICNVIRTCLIQAIINETNVINTDDVELAVRKELSKMGQFYSNR
jgi:SpoVK/Ycf46/Vps4 family AAA+-type ATPase